MPGIQINQAQAAALRADYGQNPLGRLGGRAVAVGNPGAGRAAAAAAPRVAVGGFFERVANALTPASSRADSKFRVGAKDFSEKAGALLGSLFQAGNAEGTPAAMLSALVELRGLAAPMTSRGASYEQVLGTRLEANLSQLSEADLATLAKNLNSGQMVAVRMAAAQRGDNAVIEDLALLQSKVRGEVAARANGVVQGRVMPALAKAVEAARAVPFDATKFLTAYGAAGSPAKAVVNLYNGSDLILGGMPEGIARNRATGPYSAGVIKDAMAQLPLADRQAVLRALPPADLAELAKGISPTGAVGSQVVPLDGNYLVDVPLDGGPAAPESMHDSIILEIARRNGDDTGALQARADVFQGAGGVTPAQPKEYVAELAGLKEDIRQLDKIVTTFSIDPGPAAAVKGAVADRVASQLAALATPGPDGTTGLSKLSNAELQSLAESARFLGVDLVRNTETGAPEVRRVGAGGVDAADARVDIIKEAIDARKAPLQAAFARSVQDLAAAVTGGNSTTIATAARAMARAEVAFIAIDREFGNQLAGPDAMSKFREEQQSSALAGLSVDQLSALYTRLRSNSVREFGAAIAEIAGDITEIAPEELVVEMGMATKGLGRLTGTVADMLEKAGVDLATLAPPTSAIGDNAAARLADPERAALRDAFGVHVPEGGGEPRLERGTVGDRFMAVVSQVVTAPLTGSQLAVASVGGVPQGVCQAFWVDAGRGDVTLPALGLGHQPLLDRSGWGDLAPQQQEARLVGGRAELLAFCGGDEALMMRVSQYANQSTLAGIEVALATSPDSPVRRDDGSIATPSSTGDQAPSYALRRDPNGDVRITAQRSGAFQALIGSDGSMSRVDPEFSRHTYSMELVIPRGGGPVVLSKLVEFDYQHRPLLPGKNYAMPKSADEIMTHPAMRADFGRYVASQYGSENFDFIVDVMAFEADPTALRAQAIYKKYVQADSPDQVNLPMRMQAAPAGFADLAGPDLLVDRAVPADLFKAQGAEIRGVMMRNYGRGFMQALGRGESF